LPAPGASQIHQHPIVKSGRKFGKAVAIFGKQVRDADIFHFFIMLLQSLPGSGLCRIDIFHSNTLFLFKNRKSDRTPC